MTVKKLVFTSAVWGIGIGLLGGIGGVLFGIGAAKIIDLIEVNTNPAYLVKFAQALVKHPDEFLPLFFCIAVLGFSASFALRLVRSGRLRVYHQGIEE